MARIETVEARLRSSDAFRSFASEQRVFDLMVKRRWLATHGYYYTDLKTGKSREIDVVARQVWRRELKSGPQSVAVNLLIEVKSAREFHILFSLSGFGLTRGDANAEWLGYAREHSSVIIDTLERAGLDRESIPRVMQQYSSAAYPNSRMVVYPLRLDAPKPPFAASAFRETNIGGEKELENSVVWRSHLALRSAVQTMKENYIQGQLDDLHGNVSAAAEFGENPEESAVSGLAKDVRHVELYHPVIVVDAQVWATLGEDLRSIPWCRLVQVGTAGYPVWWTDIVHSSNFDEYVTTTSQYYFRSYRRLRTKPLYFGRTRRSAK